MRLIVEHSTCYRYSDPVRFVVQSLKLSPSRFDGQRVIRWSVAAEGCTITAAFTDGYGDGVLTLTCAEARDEVHVKVSGEVVTADMAGVLRGHKEKISPRAFLRQTGMTEPSDEIRDLALGVAAGLGRTDDQQPGTLDLAHALSDAVADAVVYAPGTTHAHTTAGEALTEGQGVCQDHAHILITAARLLGLPARYVSGYLFADANGVPHEAAHGWAELWLDGLGWVGFDASNRTCPTEAYIRLGAGLDARDAAPIKGVHVGAAEEAMDVSLVVQEAQQQ
ncbi:transglutaminase family protein [Pyruvatibacter mobilis]|uniref:transglutaminase family protein n=1 Tax=Pyruvatibacter mobilis TaxID=1712261 RepID=UPI003C7A2B1A